MSNIGTSSIIESILELNHLESGMDEMKEKRRKRLVVNEYHVRQIDHFAGIRPIS